MSEAKTLRQAENEVVIVGTLVEKNLEVKEFDDRTNGGKYKAMTGNVVIRTGENETHTVRFFAKEKTQKGETSKQFTGLETVNAEYVSVADAAEKEGVQASVVRVVGTLGLNEYFGQDGKLKQFNQIDGRFISRLKDGADSTPKAEFDIEGLVNKVVEEYKDDEETGRAHIELVVPLYNSKVIPLTFVVSGEGKDYVVENFTKGSSVRVYGDIVNFRQETKKIIEMGFGKPKEEVTVTFKNENAVTGGTVYEEGIHDGKIFGTDLIQQALVERNKFLEDLKTRSQKNDNKQEQRNSFGSAAKTEASKTQDIGLTKKEIENLF